MLYEILRMFTAYIQTAGINMYLLIIIIFINDTPRRHGEKRERGERERRREREEKVLLK